MLLAQWPARETPQNKTSRNVLQMIHSRQSHGSLRRFATLNMVFGLILFLL